MPRHPTLRDVLQVSARIGRVEVDGRPTVVVVSGGNIEYDSLQRLMREVSTD